LINPIGFAMIVALCGVTGGMGKPILGHENTLQLTTMVNAMFAAKNEL